ncbi:hypothetical protein CHUAL_008668 [Chamberlinius hualienensis]
MSLYSGIYSREKLHPYRKTSLPLPLYKLGEKPEEKCKSTINKSEDTSKASKVIKYPSPLKSSNPNNDFVSGSKKRLQPESKEETQKGGFSGTLKEGSKKVKVRKVFKSKRGRPKAQLVLTTMNDTTSSSSTSESLTSDTDDTEKSNESSSSSSDGTIGSTILPRNITKTGRRSVASGKCDKETITELTMLDIDSSLDELKQLKSMIRQQLIDRSVREDKLEKEVEQLKTMNYKLISDNKNLSQTVQHIFTKKEVECIDLD